MSILDRVLGCVLPTKHIPKKDYLAAVKETICKQNPEEEINTLQKQSWTKKPMKVDIVKLVEIPNIHLDQKATELSIVKFKPEQNTL